MKKAPEKLEVKVTPLVFTLLAIDNNTKKSGGKYKGMHTVYSGFNQAFRQLFPKEDVIKFIDKMHDEGKLYRKYAKGGAMIYKPEDAPADYSKADDMIAEVLGKKKGRK